MKKPKNRWIPGTSKHPPTMFKPGNPYRWRPGESGNPVGMPRTRVEFERRFYEALIGEGSPEEAAELLWNCARRSEPWAIQYLLGRLAPQDMRLKITHEGGTSDGQYDLTKLTDAELEQFIELAGRARAVGEDELRARGTVAALPAGGESETQIP
jgi:hypothetical protein